MCGTKPCRKCEAAERRALAKIGKVPKRKKTSKTRAGAWSGLVLVGGVLFGLSLLQSNDYQAPPRPLPPEL